MYIGTLILLLLIVIILALSIYQSKKKVKEMNLILKDILEGNLDRKLLVKDHTELSETYFIINEIVAKYKEELVNLKQSEKTYKQLVTNLSHDIRTPLASLMGYLSAIQDGIVTGEEKEEFLKLSSEKANILKDYIDTLFEWLKLESGERIFEFERTDIGELSREVMGEWILQLEQNQIEYQIRIPEEEIELVIDAASYRRILNNLLQNVLIHSHADLITLEVREAEENVYVSLTDNGVGISEKDLPHIFERLYRCDVSRNGKGNGLGLAIVMELIKANKGSIHVESKEAEGSHFLIKFSKNKIETSKSQG
ncbi:MAG: HAMP domain-containing histidine kinase [Lachnospiraceae bacterium]|nr:HAMP domain-containing histidine kinase [Lachnospiraceae bacterium]